MVVNKTLLNILMKSRGEKSTNPTFFTTIEQREDEKNETREQ